jgi:uncharacterized protein with NAD-binding domain and iron-sulfur cluster
MTKKKIAILGGGVGAVTAAFELTSQNDWQNRYEITLYQLGYRLGGKGASGRNSLREERIEEHGLHIWLGFYENAFRLMRACYQELDRPKTTPLATMEQAFKPHSFITVQEDLGDRFATWNVDFGTDGSTPGVGGYMPSPIDFVVRILEMLIEVISGTNLELIYQSNDGRGSRERSLLGRALQQVSVGVGRSAVSFASRSSFVHALLDLVREAVAVPVGLKARLLAPVSSALDRFVEKLWADFEHSLLEDDEIRRAIIVLDFGRVVIRGMLRDRLLTRGFSVINDEDFTEWLARHGALPVTLRSALVRAWYDLVFGFPGGDTTMPGRCEAGTTLNAFMRLALTYKGAIFWEMQAGMGDTIFAPYYEVLARRGVKFEFFHKVTNLGVGADGRTIETIDFDVQATLEPGLERYEPLVDVKGLPCWPSHPLYDQLVEGDELRDRGIDLESSWTDWAPVATKSLTRGSDFDDVVLGIALGALPYLAPELIAARDEWKRMVEEVKTVQTLAMQLWLAPDREGLGWPYPRTVMTAYADPYNTWADMTHLVERECWPPDHYPFSLAYFCGPMPDAHPIPPFTDHEFPERERARIFEMAEEWLNLYTGHLWPHVTEGSGSGTRLNYDFLVDPAGGAGVERLRAQYFRANIDPTERYVLSVPGSSKHRLHPGRSGFENLFLAGDWTQCGINAGCVEGATISGLLCAESLSGRRVRIEGNYDVEHVLDRATSAAASDSLIDAAE